jgi:ribosomal protein L44E
MPAPIKKLNDAFADYSLRIRCKKCKHERITEPHALARIAGWEAELKALALRMRCSHCHARGQCDLTPFTEGRPRGYRSH